MMRLNKQVLGAGHMLQSTNTWATQYVQSIDQNHRTLRIYNDIYNHMSSLMAKVTAVAPDFADAIAEALTAQTNQDAAQARNSLKESRLTITLHRLDNYHGLRELHKKFAKIKLTTKDVTAYLARHGVNSPRNVLIANGDIQWTADYLKLGVTRELTVTIETHKNTIHVTDGRQSATYRLATPTPRYNSRSSLLDTLSIWMTKTHQALGGQAVNKNMVEVSPGPSLDAIRALAESVRERVAPTHGDHFADLTQYALNQGTPTPQPHGTRRVVRDGFVTPTGPNIDAAEPGDF